MKERLQVAFVLATGKPMVHTGNKHSVTVFFPWPELTRVGKRPNNPVGVSHTIGRESGRGGGGRALQMEHSCFPR